MNKQELDNLIQDWCKSHGFEELVDDELTDLKQIMSSVLDYCEPDGNKAIPNFELKNGEPPDVTGYREGFKDTISEMQSKREELGLGK